jgi:hypothetical protein
MRTTTAGVSALNFATLGAPVSIPISPSAGDDPFVQLLEQS